MHSLPVNVDAPTADTHDLDHTITINEHSPYFLHGTEVIGLAPDPQRVDHLSLNEDEDDDIYRGEQPAPPRESPSLESVSSSSSSSSSSSASSIFGGRLGAIAGAVELAIATWARAWASSSSLSTSSSTSSSASINTMTRSQLSSRRRRNRRKSLADHHNQKSERDIAARIRAREESRYIPRAFDLYVPSLSDGADVPAADVQRRHFIHTDSLPLIISRLGAALKDNGRARRARAHGAPPEMQQQQQQHPAPSIMHHDYMMPEDPAEAVAGCSQQDPEPHIRRKVRKGKRKATLPQPAVPVAYVPSSGSEHHDPEKAWWLDVSSPTWEDMRAIAKLLHLHPLTLEDILQQDPREKLELFPRLGYYFIVFRAVESQQTRERFRALHTAQDESPMEPGIVGEVNIYLVVFREGICSFHFADIGEHVYHVRKKIFKLSESVNMTSDWIAHGIMDSVVDAFFPFLEAVEKEVADIETLVITDPVKTQPELPAAESQSDAISVPSLEKVATHQSSKDPETLSITVSEKVLPTDSLKIVEKRRRTQFALPATWPLFFRRLRRHACLLYARLADLRVVFRHTPTMGTTTTVHRMARTRRMVTSLTRILAHKSEVVAQLQKRLLMGGESWLGHGKDHDQDVFIYMGDVQDHILSLQQSLAHYERVLSQSHPTYLSHLRLSVSRAQSGTDTALVTLSTISFGVVCIQTLIGLCSMNVNIPANNTSGNRYYVFGIVIALSGVITMIYGYFVRLWWIWSKQKRPTKHRV